MLKGNHWFADINTVESDGDTFDPAYPWQPFLQCDGHVARIDMWFQTEADCLRFIESEVIGAGADLTLRTS